MKKFILLLLCLLLLGTLAACGQANASEMRIHPPADKTTSPQAQPDKTENESAGQDAHIHTPAKEEQTVSDPINGFCGNTQTILSSTDFFDTVHQSNPFQCTFMGSYSVELTAMLINLDYDPAKVCLCSPEYNVDTEFGINYGIHLSNGYARCEKGQADLTQEQVDTIAKIIAWAKEQNANVQS
ncbi:MAG: hypothetical protein HFE78_01230 [Clostridiales bacterium]|nr:hypothetical protein [Clostridiales bacterium]